MKEAISVNRLAWRLLEKLLNNSELYNVEIEKTKSKATIVDAGIKAKGGFEAGKLVTEICMGGCGKARIGCRRYDQMELATIFVYTDHPVIATLGSQYAGWQIEQEGFFAIGSGPGRALALKPKKIYVEIGYRDDFDKAVVVLETEKYPSEDLVQHLAKDCHVPIENLALILTPTTSMVGAVQVSGRIIETGIHKLRKLGLNVDRVSNALGCAPIPPVHPNFTNAMSRTNDAILYGGIVYLKVKYEDEIALTRIVEKAPSRASKSYGKPFIRILKEAGNNFYKVDPNIFAPAVVIMSNSSSGNTFRSGETNPEALAESFGL